MYETSIIELAGWWHLFNYLYGTTGGSILSEPPTSHHSMAIAIELPSCKNRSLTILDPWNHPPPAAHLRLSYGTIGGSGGAAVMTWSCSYRKAPWTNSANLRIYLIQKYHYCLHILSPIFFIFSLKKSCLVLYYKYGNFSHSLTSWHHFGHRLYGKDLWV